MRAGNPLVRQNAREVSARELDGGMISSLIEDMLDTMRDENGVGLAAPQVQTGLQVLVYHIEPNERYPDIEESIGPQAMINPHITGRSSQLKVDWEGCLSLPDLRGKVPRHRWIDVEWIDLEGNTRTRRVEEFEARVIQHETDHLHGALFVDQMRSMKSLSFSREYRRYHNEQ